MIRKTPIRGTDKVSVTFQTDGHADARSIAVLGDFNDWDPSRLAMKRRKNGTWSATIRLPKGKRYGFRYLIDETEWETDEASDAVEPNRFGSTNAVVET